MSSLPSALHGSSLERINASIKYMQERFLGTLNDPALGCNVSIPKAMETFGPEVRLIDNRCRYTADA